MADESLKRLLKTIAAEEAEMQRYRARLAPRLRRRPRFPWLMPIGVAATVALVSLIFLVWPRQIIFSPLDMDQVHAMAMGNRGGMPTCFYVLSKQKTRRPVMRAEDLRRIHAPSFVPRISSFFWITRMNTDATLRK